MITKLINTRDNELNKRLLFDTLNLPKIAFLCGANGSGKSTLIQCFLENRIKSFHDEEAEYVLYHYSNSKNNYRELGNPGSKFDYQDCFDLHNIISKLDSELISEGQRMIYSMRDFFSTLEELPVKEDTYYLILIDEFDSGLSINMIDKVLNKINVLNKREDFQFIISFNNYQIVKYFYNRIVSMYDGQSVYFESYEEFQDFICNQKYLDMISKNTEINMDDLL